MTGEELDRAMASLREQQAQLTATVDRVAANVDAVALKVDAVASKIDQAAGSITNLSAASKIQVGKLRDLSELKQTLAERRRESEERGRRIDKSLNALINTVERYISKRRNKKA